MLRFWTTAAAVALMLSATAHAAVIRGALSGTIAGNTRDTYGLFGAAGASLSGRTLTAAYRYDTAVASTYSLQSGSDSYSGSGGLTLSVTIGSASVVTAGTPDAEIIDTQDGSDTEVVLANLAPTPLFDFTLFVQGSWVPGVTIDRAFTLDPAYYGQTIYLSADGSHYDVLNFVGISTPALPIPEPAAAPVATLGLLAVAWLRRWLPIRRRRPA